MDGLATIDIPLLVGGAFVAGVVNTLAGGGSLLTVPLLVLLGLPGTLANGTNRVGVLVQCLVAMRGFHAEGVMDVRGTARLLVPAVVGALVGALLASRMADETFERIFGIAMLVMLVPTLRQLGGAPKTGNGGRPWHPLVGAAVFFGIGLFGGALQAGVGLPLLVALIHSGYDVVRGNAVKVALIAALTATAIPVFVIAGQVAWLHAAVLAVGFSAGAALGARLVVRRGERIVRPVLGVAVVVLAARMIGLY